MQTFINKLIFSLSKATPSQGKQQPEIGSNPEQISHKSSGLSRDTYLGDQVVFQLDNESLSYSISRKGFSNSLLKDFGKVFLPIKNATDEKRVAILRREVPMLLDGAKLRNPRYGLCMSAGTVAIRTFRLPKMSASELRNAVYYAGQKKTPFPLDDAYWNYRITDEVTSGGQTNYVILLIAVAKGQIDTLLEFFAEFNIEFSFIYQDIETLGEALKSLDDFNEDYTYGVMNVRTGRTDMSLYQGCRLQFFHRGSTGSKSLTLPSIGATQATAMFPKMLQRFAEGLAIEVQNALDYYGANSKVDDIKCVFIYGDMTFNEELIERLRSQFDVNFVQFPVLSIPGLTLSPDQTPELISTTLPVVITSACNRRLTDLSPPFLTEKRNRKQFRRVALQSAAALLIALGLTWHQANSKLTSVSQTRDILIEQTTSFESSPAFAAYRVLQQEIARQERILSSIDDNHTERYLVLKELMNITPPQITVTYFEYYPKNTQRPTHLGGVVSTTKEAPEVILAEFVSRMNASPLFSGVTLIRHTKDITGGTRMITFSLDCEAQL